MEISYLADCPQHVDLISSWYFSEWGNGEENNSEELVRDRLCKKLNRDQLPIPIVATSGDVLLGTAQLKLREMDIYPEREFWVGGVYVAEAGRGAGIGAALTNRVIELAKNIGAQELWLQTVALDGGLYTKCGFTPFNEVHYKGDDVLVMRHILSE